MKDCDMCGESQKLCDGYTKNPNNPKSCWYHGSDGLCKNKLFRDKFPVEILTGTKEDPNGDRLTPIDVDMPSEDE